VHGTTLKIREIFEEAAAKAPSILFIDEFEALVPARAAIGGGHQYKTEEVNEFLARLDACSERRIYLSLRRTSRGKSIPPCSVRVASTKKSTLPRLILLPVAKCWRTTLRGDTRRLT